MMICKRFCRIALHEDQPPTAVATPAWREGKFGGQKNGGPRKKAAAACESVGLLSCYGASSTVTWK